MSIKRIETGLHYIGQGSFIAGIPARDLSATEVKQYGIDLLLATGLYEPEQQHSTQPAQPDMLKPAQPEKEH